ELERDVPDPSAIEAPLPLDGATTYVRVMRFGEEAARDLEEALEREAEEGRRRIVLDLRGNPGGLVTEAVETAALFLPEDVTVFSTRGRKRDVDRDYVTEDRGDLRNMRLVVLIDEGSASAAEAVAGALQDLDRAVLVGRRTFGKALIQAPFFLPDGDIVWLTVGRVLTPSGRVIQRDYRGLTADQYRSFAGTSVVPEGGDSLPLFRTKGGRPVRGGGGISPDLETPGSPPPPPWWSAAREAGWIQEVVDEAAATLSVDPADGSDPWRGDEARHDALVDSLLRRVRAELDVAAEPGPPLRSWMRRTVAGRVASVRWGVDAGSAFRVHTDPDVRAAVEAFPDWNRILAGTRSEAPDR
ncbi:MAG: S41 family peptidase, partial [Gemmatimonadota bacterium]